MLILLSSAHSPRYREDILRCLAAPIGSIVQFRYDKRWIANELVDRVERGELALPSSGIVCYVDLQGAGPLTMIPVRSVRVERINVHGRTVSIGLRMKEFNYAEPVVFTKELFDLSGNVSPQKINDEVEGKYLFEVDSLPVSLKTGQTVGDWEEVVVLLRDQAAFADEPFFWTVVGAHLEGSKMDSNVFSEWPQKPISDPFDLLVYHYQPKPGPRIDSKLTISTGSSLERSGPSEIDIDSRYDLKRWRLYPEPSGYSARETWIRIRTADRWNLDLSVTVKGPFGRTLAKAVVAGALIAVPSIITILTQKDVSETMRMVISGVSLVSGILAASAVVFSIEKLA